MNVALLAACCMVVQDVLGVIMVQAEASNRGWLAGFVDAGMWLFGINTTTAAVTSHGSTRVLVMALVSVANVFGTKLGQVTGQKLMRRLKEREQHAQ